MCVCVSASVEVERIQGRVAGHTNTHTHTSTLSRGKAIFCLGSRATGVEKRMPVTNAPPRAAINAPMAAGMDTSAPVPAASAPTKPTVLFKLSSANKTEGG